MPRLLPTHQCNICGASYGGKTLSESKLAASNCEHQGQPKYRYEDGVRFDAPSNKFSVASANFLDNLDIFDFLTGLESRIVTWQIVGRTVARRLNPGNVTYTHLPAYLISRSGKVRVALETEIEVYLPKESKKKSRK